MLAVGLDSVISCEFFAPFVKQIFLCVGGGGDEWR